MVTLLYVFIWWDLVPTSSWGKLHLVPRAVVIVTMISIRTHSVLNTQFLQVTDFHGFILFSVSLIPVYHRRIWHFPMMGVQRDRGNEGKGDCMFLKKTGISRRGMKKEGGNWYTFPQYVREITHACIHNLKEKPNIGVNYVIIWSFFRFVL